MNFEDLQTQWKNQFAGLAPASDPKAAIGLLEQIRRNERRFRFAVMLLVLRDIVLLFVCIQMLQFFLSEGVRRLSPEIFKRDREIRFVELALLIALSIAAVKFRPPSAQLTPSATEGSAALPGRVRGDRRRFDAMIRWRDVREMIAGICLVFVTVLHALHVKQYPALVWIAAGLFSISSISFLTYRLRMRAQRAPANDTLLGTLTRSIDQTRIQIQLLDNLWWYITPIIFGGLLMGPIHGALTSGGVHQSAIVALVLFPAAGWGSWRCNRWAARNRLRPRLEKLEKLRLDLSIEASADQS